MNKGLLFVLTGASSVGKKDIRDRLLGDGQLHLNYSISMTTRPKRGEEVDGRDYYFVNHEAFAQALRNRELLEYTEFDGYYYGTPKHQVDFLLNSGKNVMVEVEAQGVGQIKLQYPDALCVFVEPKSMEELEKQIMLRYRDDAASAQRRINKALVELELSTLFRHTVKNTDVNAAYEEICELLKEHMQERGNKG